MGMKRLAGLLEISKLPVGWEKAFDMYVTTKLASKSKIAYARAVAEWLTKGGAEPDPAEYGVTGAVAGSVVRDLKGMLKREGAWDMSGPTGGGGWNHVRAVGA